MTVNVYLVRLIQELIPIVGALSSTDCTIERFRFTPTFSEASYTAIIDGVVRSRSEKQIRAILEVKRDSSMQRDKRRPACRRRQRLPALRNRR
jgi:hypothetical protein